MKSMLLATLMATAHPVSNGIEDLDRLDARITEFVTPAGRTALLIDRRLRLAACNETAVIEWLDAQSLAVRCTTPGWRLRVALGDGSAVPADSRPAIKRGDAVEARFEADDFDITTTMIAMEDGRTGDSIRVKNPDTGRMGIATVSGKGSVIFSH